MRKADFTVSEKNSINSDINNIKFDIGKIKDHVTILNGETGQLRDLVKEIKGDLTNRSIDNAYNIQNIQKNIIQIQTDMDWLKRWFWVVATASVGATITSLVNLMRG